MGRSEAAKAAMTEERKAALTEARRRSRAGKPGRAKLAAVEKEIKSQLGRRKAYNDAIWWAATNGEEKKPPTPLHELARASMKDDPHRFMAALVKSLPANPEPAKGGAGPEEPAPADERDRRFLDNVLRAITGDDSGLQAGAEGAGGEPSLSGGPGAEVHGGPEAGG